MSRPTGDTPGWTILSAKHDILYPTLSVESYDTTIADLAERDAPVEPDAYQHTQYPWGEPEYETALDFWTRRVHFGLASWLEFKSGFPEERPHCRRLIVLAGDRYVDPLLEHDVFEPFPWETWLPFQEYSFDGIGQQMEWLTEEADRYEPGRSDTGEQIDLDRATPTAESDLQRPDTTGQTDWADWLDDRGDSDG